MNCSLRLGWSEEVEPVLSEMFLTGVDHVYRQTCLGQERDFGGYELCGTRSLVGQLSLCYMLKV